MHLASWSSSVRSLGPSTAASKSNFGAVPVSSMPQTARSSLLIVTALGTAREDVVVTTPVRGNAAVPCRLALVRAAQRGNEQQRQDKLMMGASHDDLQHAARKMRRRVAAPRSTVLGPRPTTSPDLDPVRASASRCGTFAPVSPCSFTSTIARCIARAARVVRLCAGSGGVARVESCPTDTRVSFRHALPAGHRRDLEGRARFRPPRHGGWSPPFFT